MRLQPAGPGTKCGLRAAVLVLLAGLLALAVFGCEKAPPQVRLGDVVDFWVPDHDGGSYHPKGPLDSVVASYDTASGHSFDSDTTPDFFAEMVLRGGTIIQLQFSSQFPADCVLVSVTSAPTAAAADVPWAGTWYHARAPGLLKALRELVGSRLDLTALDTR